MPNPGLLATVKLKQLFQQFSAARGANWHLTMMYKPKDRKQIPLMLPGNWCKPQWKQQKCCYCRASVVQSALQPLRIMRGNYSSMPHWYSLFLTSDNMSHNAQLCGQL